MNLQISDNSLIYCSDGILSANEFKYVNNLENQSKSWWNVILYYIDYCGERLAWFFGITSPKYDYILNELNHENLSKISESI